MKVDDIYKCITSIDTKVMGKKSNKEYTTIQIRKELREHIRNFCKERGWVISAATENYWLSEISASMSGSISIMGA